MYSTASLVVGGLITVILIPVMTTVMHTNKLIYTETRLPAPISSGRACSCMRRIWSAIHRASGH